MKDEMKKSLKKQCGNIEVHEYLWILRKRSRITMNEIYALTKITPGVLSEFENGKRQLPEEVIAKLAKALTKVGDQILDHSTSKI